MKQNGLLNRLLKKKIFITEKCLCERSLFMENKTNHESLFRVWVDTNRRIVSFHEEEGCQLLEFRSRELFLSCVDQYTGRQYRYQ